MQIEIADDDIEIHTGIVTYTNYEMWFYKNEFTSDRSHCSTSKCFKNPSSLLPNYMGRNIPKLKEIAVQIIPVSHCLYCMIVPV